MSAAFPIDRPAFEAGLFAGMVAAAGTLAIRLGAGRRLPPTAGVGITVAAYAGLAREGLLSTGLAPALTLLALGGTLWRGRTRPLGVAFVVAGGALLAEAVDVRRSPWPQIVAAFIATLGGSSAADFDARFRRHGYGPVLFAVSAYAVYAVVPETDPALALLGAALPIALATWLLRWDTLGRGGAFAACGMLGWVVAHGGAPRSSALVGGAGALGLFVVEPVVRAIARRRTSPLDVLVPRGSGLAAAAIQGCVVAVTGRFAGTQRALWAAVAVAVGTMALLVQLGLAVLDRNPSARRRGG